MKLLVSSPFWLFLIDTHSHQVDVVESSRREYYGITWTPDARLVLSHSFVNNQGIATFSDYVRSEKGGLSIDSNLIAGVLSCPHQIVCIKSLVATANTGRNCLTLIRTEDLFFRHYWFDDQKWDKAEDGQTGAHFNSVYFKDNHLYLLAHNHEEPSFILKLSWPDLKVVERIDTLARWAHNVWLTDRNQLIVCNSMNRSIDDVVSGSVLWRATEHNTITRGLACAGDLVFVGCSGYAARGYRTESDGGIWILDRRNWQQLDFISMPFAGNIHDIRVLDEIDECHELQPFERPIPKNGQAAEEFQEFAKLISARKPTSDWKLQGGRVEWAGGTKITVTQPFGIATFAAAPQKDVCIKAKVSLHSAPAESHISLVSRYLGPSDDNMYIGMLYKHESAFSIQIWKNLKGAWSLIDSTPLPEHPDSFAFETKDHNLNVSVDGRVVLRVCDNDLKEPGQVGIRGTSGSIEEFQMQAI